MIPLRDTQRSYSTPVVTILLIAVNAVVFLFELSLDPWSRNQLLATYGLVPAKLHLVSFLTSMFLHGGWLHIIGNMWFLWIFGDNIEDILGHVQYLVFYLLCGFAAAATQIALSPDSWVPTIGASGAIAGVMGAYLIKFPHSRIRALVFIFIFFTTVELPAAWFLLYWFVIQLFSGAGSLENARANQGVAWFAHVGGFIAGIVLVKILPTSKPYQGRTEIHW
ncbi:MAG TPA: rhomboid family intramembrane serine protease [Bryobacteraceae bacterium]|nr:rhomboid family intramembrane serine protease [Bryobacteraceae bacterium]